MTIDQTDEVMTLDEIRSRFPSEWVLIGDPVTDKHHRVLTGRVVAHSPNRDEVYETGARLRLKRSAFLYLGELPDDVAVIL